MTAYLCPECRRPLDVEGHCPAGHRFGEQDGVLILVGSDLAPRLSTFIEILRDYRQREGKRILERELYDDAKGFIPARAFELKNI